MMGRRQIVRAAQKGDAHVLVTLIDAQGSYQRQSDARLLTSNAIDQSYAGSITGGLIEAEIVKKAASRVHSGAVVERYSTPCDEIELLFGRDGGSPVDLLHEPAGTPEFYALMYALARSLEGVSYTVVTRLPGLGSQFGRALLAPDGGMDFASPGIDPLAIANALRRGSHWQAGHGGVQIERLSPPQRMVVLCGGDDAKPLVRLAALLGWNVVVGDSRAALARTARFPEAQNVIDTSGRGTQSLGISNRDAVVLMTHSYDQDRDWLAAVLPIAPRYLGVLGARHRSSLMVSEAAAMTGLPLSTCCERIHAPVGLDRLVDSPEGIALAFLSEAQRCCMETQAPSARLSVEDIAAQIGSGGAFRYPTARRSLRMGQFV